MNIKKFLCCNCLKSNHAKSYGNKVIDITVHETIGIRRKIKDKIVIDYSTRLWLNEIDFSLDIHKNRTSTFSDSQIEKEIDPNKIQEDAIESIQIKLINHFKLDEDDMKIIEGCNVKEMEIIIKLYSRLLDNYSNYISSMCDVSLDIENVNNYNLSIDEVFEIYRLSLEKCSKVIITLMETSNKEQCINDVLNVFCNAINECSKIIISICSKNKSTSNDTKKAFEIITLCNNTHIRYCEAIGYLSNI
jgi:hypothetical protein